MARANRVQPTKKRRVVGVGWHQVWNEQQKHSLRQEASDGQANLGIWPSWQVERKHRGADDDDRWCVQVSDIVSRPSFQFHSIIDDYKEKTKEILLS